MTVKNMIPAWVDGVLRPVEKLEVHQRGLRHKAVSVFLFEQGRLLIQKRAAGKYHSPLLWANTCCTHPHWGEPDEICAKRRLAQELNIKDVDLQACGELTYRADVGGGLIEHEEVALFRGDYDTLPDMMPNPEEVAATDWVTLDALTERIAATPERFTPWLQIYMAQYRDRIERV